MTGEVVAFIDSVFLDVMGCGVLCFCFFNGLIEVYSCEGNGVLRGIPVFRGVRIAVTRRWNRQFG